MERNGHFFNMLTLPREPLHRHYNSLNGVAAKELQTTRGGTKHYYNDDGLWILLMWLLLLSRNLS